MSVILVDRGNPSHVLKLNLWIWRTIQSAAARLGVLDVDALALLEPFCGGLDRDDAHRLGKAIELEVLSGVGPTDRLLLDGAVAASPDDLVLHRDPSQQSLNYSASRDALASFVTFCGKCDGFDQ